MAALVFQAFEDARGARINGVRGISVFYRRHACFVDKRFSGKDLAV